MARRHNPGRIETYTFSGDHWDIPFSWPLELFNAALAVPPWRDILPDGWSHQRVAQEVSSVFAYPNNMAVCAYIGNNPEMAKITGLALGHAIDDIRDHRSFLVVELPHLRKNIPAFLCKVDNGGIQYLRDLVVHPYYQGGPTGRMLLDGFCKRAKDYGSKLVVTRTHPLDQKGIALFKRAGFEEVFGDSKPERLYFARELK